MRPFNVYNNTGQGTTLAPILYIIYTNDVPGCLMKGILSMFANGPNVNVNKVNLIDAVEITNYKIGKVLMSYQLVLVKLISCFFVFCFYSRL
jgi:hypothetical protein